ATGSGVYTDLVQHDAAINPGNSGGPLLNLSGEVIGVNTLGIPLGEDGNPVQGLFFAVPSNTVKQIVDSLIKEGEVVYPYFGIRYEPVTEEIAAQLNLVGDDGVLVTEAIPGDPAADAGIQADDVILAIGGEQIDARNSFQDVLFDHEPGETVEVTLDRRGERVQVRVTLGIKPPT
ncbi:MAG: PDZ domain-containing protein, partial [Chloroflexota bacterium]|nr:PDZ domain-containing protein [Chloroflexota bacterium]